MKAHAQSDLNAITGVFTIANATVLALPWARRLTRDLTSEHRAVGTHAAVTSFATA